MVNVLSVFENNIECCGECQMRADTLSSGPTVDDSWDESEDCQQNVDEKVGSAS